jgi:proteasome accessory factor C
MTDTASAQLRRILAVIPQIADGREHTIAEIAERMGVDPGTIHHDMWSLVTRFQEPGGFVESVHVFLEADRVEVTSNHFRRPMRLTTSELCALELGLAVLRTQAAPDERGAIDNARKRLRQVITRLGPADGGALRHVSIGVDGYEEQLGVIRSALRSRRKLRITYRRGDADDSTKRVVCPYALVAASGMYYLVAHCESSRGLRVFRIDRMEDVRATSESFAIPESFSIGDVAHDGRVLHSADDQHTMVVRYSPRIARWLTEREGVPVAEDGSLTVEHPLVDLEWGVRHVLQYGHDAEVISPPDVRSAVVERLERMLGATTRAVAPASS